MSKMIVVCVATTGSLLSLIGALASWWRATGNTPSWLYDTFGSLSILTLHRDVGGIPLEVFTWLWFVAMGVVAARADRTLPRSWKFWIGAAAVVGVGLNGIAVVKSSFGCWTALGTTGCGLLILMTVLWDQPAGVREALREGLHSLRMVRRVPAIRASATVVLLLLTIGGVWLRASTRAIPASEAGARNFLRWYEAQTPRAEWRSPTGVRIVAFTDYQCPFCATGIPIARRLAESLTSESHPVELVERDFPLDQSCNKHARSNLHGAACEAAAAVRIVRKHRGDESAKALAASLYTIGRTMSIDRVREELGVVGLLDEFETQRDEVLKEVASDASVAAALGVTGTPTYVVNGVALKGGTSLLELAVRHELGRLQASRSVAVRTQ